MYGMIFFLAALLSVANAQFIDSCFTEPTVCEGYDGSGLGATCVPENRLFSIVADPDTNCTVVVNGSNTFYIAKNPNGLTAVGLSADACDFDTVMFGCTDYQNANCRSTGLTDFGSGTAITVGFLCFPQSVGTSTTTSGDNNSTRNDNSFSSSAASLSIIF